MNKYLTIFTLLELLAIATCSDFSYDVFGDEKPCCPAAFGHFNSDKLTDVFIIEKNNEFSIVSVLSSNTSPPLLQPSKAICKFKDEVISLVPADFDGDGAIDCLVVFSDNAKFKGKILWGNSTGWKCPMDDDYSIIFNTQPLLMDYNGDMIADLFGENEKLERVFWVFSFQRIYPSVIHMEANNTSPLSPSGGHAFIDVDDDLAADLWVVTKEYFELWKGILNFDQHEKIDHPKDATILGQSTFLDIDLDGSTELLLPVCKTADSCYLYIYEFEAKKWYDLQVNFEDEEESKWVFKKDPKYLYTDTITARAGDYNFDGYPDILITLFNNSNMPRVVLLENVPCSGFCPYGRTFLPRWRLFDNFDISVMGTFFDFNEDGALDVFLVNASKDGLSYSAGAFKNPLEFDATFLKVIVLSGNCYYNCSFDQKLHGTNQPGPSIIYSITTTEGEAQRSCATQMSQSSHAVLQLPFVTFGLGRSWNFVDTLELGVPIARGPALGGNDTRGQPQLLPNDTRGQPRLLRSTFTQIIPNSQVVVIPYPITQPERWVHKLFITPSKSMLLTAGVLIATCVFVGAIIIFLHLLEMKEDKKERLQESQRFHFVAM